MSGVPVWFCETCKKNVTGYIEDHIHMAGGEMMSESVKKLLIEDIRHLNDKDIHKLYKYVRRYLIAKIEGLKDPLECTSTESKTEQKKYTKSEIIKAFEALPAPGNFVNMFFREIDK